MATKDFIPVVDFKDVLSCTDLSTCAAVQELHSAFTTVGFVFIKNHGVKADLINKVNSVALEFFEKPLEVKKKSMYCHSEKDTKHNGYICLFQERKTLATPGDHNEAFDICSIEDCNYPDEDVPEFRGVMTEFYKEAIKLGLLILELIGHALKPQDPLVFVRKHSKIGQGCEENYSSARVLHYPPVPSSSDLKEFLLSSKDKVRLRKHEHVDYGTITLLFPDPNVGGLQVKKVCGGWIDVPCLPNALLVNLGGLMEQWTSDKYMATPHRVIVPKDESDRTTPRQGCAVFIHPDASTLIECVDGANKYKPFIAGEHNKNRIKDTLHPSFEN